MMSYPAKAEESHFQGSESASRRGKAWRGERRHKKKHLQRRRRRMPRTQSTQVWRSFHILRLPKNRSPAYCTRIHVTRNQPVTPTPRYTFSLLAWLCVGDMVLRAASTQEVVVMSVRHKTVPALVSAGRECVIRFPCQSSTRGSNVPNHVRQPGLNNPPGGWRAVPISARSRQSIATLLRSKVHSPISRVSVP